MVDYVLLAVLFVCAVFIVISITIQKTSEEGLSGTISGKTETYYGNERASHKGQALRKWTLIAVAVFAIAVTIAYVIQPDYSSSTDFLESWKEVTEFSSIFG